MVLYANFYMRAIIDRVWDALMMARRSIHDLGNLLNYFALSIILVLF